MRSIIERVRSGARKKDGIRNGTASNRAVTRSQRSKSVNDLQKVQMIYKKCIQEGQALPGPLPKEPHSPDPRDQCFTPPKSASRRNEPHSYSILFWEGSGI